MNKNTYRLTLLSLLLILVLPVLTMLMCYQSEPLTLKDSHPKNEVEQVNDNIETEIKPPLYVAIGNEVKIKNYFDFIDSIVIKYDSLVPYTLSEHLLVHANPWIIDHLVDTDYYTLIEKGEFLFDQKEKVILFSHDALIIPDTNWVKKYQYKQSQTYLDINVPQYRLSIIEGNKTLHSFPVRVGRNKERYLETAGRVEDLRTRTGKGTIDKITRNPIYINPVDGHHYESTLRDDGRRTKLPQIPFLHPKINGHRWGQLIHPTTNIETLEKAYSNGCIGTGEGAAWLIYYYAPIGTPITIRYDLNVLNESGDSIQLKDIYRTKSKPAS